MNMIFDDTQVAKRARGRWRFYVQYIQIAIEGIKTVQIEETLKKVLTACSNARRAAGMTACSTVSTAFNDQKSLLVDAQRRLVDIT
jgi:hypothetical protein